MQTVMNKHTHSVARKHSVRAHTHTPDECIYPVHNHTLSHHVRTRIPNGTIPVRTQFHTNPIQVSTRSPHKHSCQETTPYITPIYCQDLGPHMSIHVMTYIPTVSLPNPMPGPTSPHPPHVRTQVPTDHLMSGPMSPQTASCQDPCPHRPFLSGPMSPQPPHVRTQVPTVTLL